MQNSLAPILYRDFIEKLEDKKKVDTTKRMKELEMEMTKESNEDCKEE